MPAKKKPVIWTEQDLRDIEKTTIALQKTLKNLQSEVEDLKHIKALKGKINN